MTEKYFPNAHEEFILQLRSFNAPYEKGLLDKTLFSFFVASHLADSEDLGVLELLPEWIIEELKDMVDVYQRDGELMLSGSHGVTDKSELGRKLMRVLGKTGPGLE